MDKATKVFLEHYGSHGFGLLVQKIVEDWKGLEVNEELVKDPENPLRRTVEEIETGLGMLYAMLNEQANK